MRCVLGQAHNVLALKPLSREFLQQARPLVRGEHVSGCLVHIQDSLNDVLLEDCLPNLQLLLLHGIDVHIRPDSACIPHQTDAIQLSHNELTGRLVPDQLHTDAPHRHGLGHHGVKSLQHFQLGSMELAWETLKVQPIALKLHLQVGVFLVDDLDKSECSKHSCLPGLQVGELVRGDPLRRFKLLFQAL